MVKTMIAQVPMFVTAFVSANAVTTSISVAQNDAATGGTVGLEEGF